MNMDLRVLIVDGNALTRFALSSIAQKLPFLSVCAEVGTARAARAGCDGQQPDLVVMDLDIPDGEGLDLLNAFRKSHPPIRCIIAADRSDPCVIRRAFAAGARAFVLKEEGPSEILSAIEEVCRGRNFTSAIVQQLLLDEATRQQSPAVSLDLLSNRELQIFDSFARGLGATAIAKALSISVKTVETHQIRIREKLRLKNSAALHEVAKRWHRRSRSRREPHSHIMEPSEPQSDALRA